jgi:pimeloyl-ACP methyl ester carboxylesterase
VGASKSSRGWRRWWWLLPLGLLMLLALGPRVRPAALQLRLPVVPQQPAALAAYVDQAERQAGPLRPDAQARIVWADPAHPQRTRCAIVYIHGFGASQGEGAPVHRELARDYGCNLYLARLPGHGLVAPEAMAGLTAQALLDGAARALAIGHALGDKVVVIGTSMGGTLAVQLAARAPQQVDALVLWSPLVRERNEALRPLLWPWGSVYLRYVVNHGSALLKGQPVSSAWAIYTHLDGYKALVDLTRGSMNPALYARIRAPVFLGYYYKDEAHQDGTVSVAAMRPMLASFGTPAALRIERAFPEAGGHVIASPLRSASSEAVRQATGDFLNRISRLPRGDAPAP